MRDKRLMTILKSNLYINYLRAYLTISEINFPNYTLSNGFYGTSCKAFI